MCAAVESKQRESKQHESNQRQYGRGLHPPDLVTPAWRECSLTRIAELESLLEWLRRRDSALADDPLATAAESHLQAARLAAGGRHRRWAGITGSVTEGARSNIDAAEATLLRMAPTDYLIGQLPSLLNGVRRHLPPADPRRLQFEFLARRLGGRLEGQSTAELSEEERGTIISAVRASTSEALREQQRIRSFRNVLAVTTLAMTLIAIGVALLGFFSPKTIPMCFQPEISGSTVVVCPTDQAVVPESEAGVADINSVVRSTAGRQDLFVIEVVGLAAASVAAATALRNIRGSSEPYGLPVALALLKLPLGAMTAFLGLLLMRGQFVPGLSNLDTPAQILAWALVFGYGQELFTRMVDKQAHTVLDAVRHEDPEEPPVVAATDAAIGRGRRKRGPAADGRVPTADPS
jgi:hypothetical protein